MRRLGNAPQAGTYYRNRPGAYALITRGDRALLTIEHGLDGPEILLPGGGIDPGESPLRALHREVMEETGWRVTIDRRLGAFQQYRHMPEYDMHARKVCHIFLGRAIHRLSDPVEAHHDAIWVPSDIVTTLLSNGADAEFLALQGFDA